MILRRRKWKAQLRDFERLEQEYPKVCALGRRLAKRDYEEMRSSRGLFGLPESRRDMARFYDAMLPDVITRFDETVSAKGIEIAPEERPIAQQAFAMAWARQMALSQAAAQMARGTIRKGYFIEP